ncbi:PT domain-containing protein [Anaerorhabdus sp.]|uniref:PT domain-containing protein n=1 Tax=Anaerorhabdus sp. TaxID=1872524 RepID=UPI002FC72709
MKKILIFLVTMLMLVTTLPGCTQKKENIENNGTPQESAVLFDESKTYENLNVESGKITANDVIIKNSTFSGDLVIDKSVGEGDVTLSGIEIKGKLIVQGGGANSVEINNSKIYSIKSGKEGSAVHIVIGKDSEVEEFNISGQTNVDVFGMVTSINVNPNAQQTGINIQPNSQVNLIEINSPAKLDVNAPLNDLNLKAESSVNITSSVNNVRVESAATNTSLNVSKDAELKNLATEIKVNVSGEGRLINLLTNDQNNLTGGMQADNTVVSSNPIQESKNETVVTTPAPTATPKPTIAPTVAPTATPTVEPTPTSVPSTPKPTENPTPIYTVSFKLDGYTVNPQNIAQGNKATQPQVQFASDVYVGSSILWLDDQGNVFDFNTPINSSKALTGKIVVNVDTVSMLETSLNEDKISAINLTNNLVLDNKGITIDKDFAIYANNNSITVNKGNGILITKEINLVLNKLVVETKDSTANGIEISIFGKTNITITDSKIITMNRGINYKVDQSRLDKQAISLNVINSEILNSRVAYDEYETKIVHGDYRGIALTNTIGDVNLSNSKILGFQYGINITGNQVSGIIDLAGLNVNLDTSKLNSWGAFNVWASNIKFNIKNSTLKGINCMVAGDNSFSTFVLNRDINGKNNNMKAIGNEVVLENTTLSNYQSAESLAGSVSQNLIRVDDSDNKIIFKGNVNLIDTTGKIESAFDIEEMDPTKVEDFIANKVDMSNATITSTSNGAPMDIIKNPYLNYGAKNIEIEYNEESQNIIVKYDIPVGLTFGVPRVPNVDATNTAGILAALPQYYENLFYGNQEKQKEAATIIGNDVIMYYYYKEIKGDGSIGIEPLKTSKNNPLVKNKFWDGFLNYYGDNNEIVSLGTNSAMQNTYIGKTLPSNKKWVTSTNPKTNTVNDGWLNNAQGKELVVEIAVIYDGVVYKSEKSIQIPVKDRSRGENVAPSIAEYSDNLPVEEPKEPIVEPVLEEEPVNEEVNKEIINEEIETPTIEENIQ